MKQKMKAYRGIYEVEMLESIHSLPANAEYRDTAYDVLNPFGGLTFVPVDIYAIDDVFYGVIR